MKKKHLREERAKRLFSVLLFVSWIGFMAFAGAYAPSIVAQLPVFKVKEILVSGNDRIRFEQIKEVIDELSTTLNGLSEENLEKALNEVSEGRVKKVYMSRSITLSGISVEVKVIERVPVAKVKLGSSHLLIDKEGVLFPPIDKRELNLPEIKTYDIDLVKLHFPKLYENVILLNLPLKEVLIKPDRVILRLQDKRIILPPLELIPGNVSERLKMIYNFPQETLDLRYGRFILVRN